MATPKPAPFNIFLDSDGPIADFDDALKNSGMHADDFKMVAGVYLWLPITKGAENAIGLLKQLDDQDLLRVFVLTKTPSGSPYAYTEKILWYRQHFPWLEDRVILTHDKHVMGGANDHLLDDRPHKANADKFKGIFTLFDVENPSASWTRFMAKVELCVKEPSNEGQAN